MWREYDVVAVTTVTAIAVVATTACIRWLGTRRCGRRLRSRWILAAIAVTLYFAPEASHLATGEHPVRPAEPSILVFVMLLPFSIAARMRHRIP
jgi:hypothetical protein